MNNDTLAALIEAEETAAMNENISDDALNALAAAIAVITKELEG